MTYDPVDPNDDGIVESDVDNTSTTTETLDADEQTINGVYYLGEYQSESDLPSNPDTTPAFAYVTNQQRTFK